MNTIPNNASVRPFRLAQANRVRSGDFIRCQGSRGLYAEAFDSIRRGGGGYYVPIICSGTGLGSQPVRTPESLVEIAEGWPAEFPV